MGDEDRTVEGIDSRSEIRRFGHMSQKKYVGEVKTAEFQEEEVLYREIDDRDMTKSQDLNYLLAYGFAEGDPYEAEPLKDTWDYRPVPEEDREEVKSVLENLEGEEVIWNDE